MANCDVYISCIPQDQGQANVLKSYLEAHGLSCVLSPERSFNTDNIDSAANAALGSCRAYILVLSAKTLCSKTVYWEAHHTAWVKCFVYLVEDCPLENWIFSCLRAPAIYQAYQNKEEALSSIHAKIKSAQEQDLFVQYSRASMPQMRPSQQIPPVSYTMPAQTAPTQPKQEKQKKSLFGFLGKSKKSSVTETAAAIAPPPAIDSVQFSAVAPEKVKPGNYLPVNIIMYEDAFRSAVDDLLKSRNEKSRESKSGYYDVQRHSKVKVILTSGDVTVEDGEEERIWNGKYIDFSFAVLIPEDYGKTQILFTASIYVNDIIATRLKLLLDCTKKAKQQLGVTREDITSAFVSYASQDRNRVAAIIQGMQKARPDMDIFFDIESLRSGQKWETALKEEIIDRDVLFLCWSQNARASHWVDMEWRLALEQKGEDGIEPIPLEAPDECPPPVELQNRHFNDRMLYVIKATASSHTQSQTPCLVRCKNREQILLNKPVFKIGKERSYVDYYISENATISREHANIIVRDGKFYVVDLNSKNGTYINGVRLQSNQETVLENGAKLCFANEEFEFHAH